LAFEEWQDYVRDYEGLMAEEAIFNIMFKLASQFDTIEKKVDYSFEQAYTELVNVFRVSEKTS